MVEAPQSETSHEDHTMAQQDAQKSEIHRTTDDATSSPASVGRGGGPAESRRDASAASNFERGAADRDIERTAEPPGTIPSPEYPGQIGGGPGAGDASSGGGAGAGIPGGGTDIRTNGAFDGGDPEADRPKVFPQALEGQKPGTDAGSQNKGELKATHVQSDESDFGGPIRIQADKLPGKK